MTTKLAAYCQEHNIKYSISSSKVTLKEWLDIYKDSFKDSGSDEGADYIGLIEDDADNLAEEEE